MHVLPAMLAMCDSSAGMCSMITLVMLWKAKIMASAHNEGPFSMHYAIPKDHGYHVAL